MLPYIAYCNYALLLLQPRALTGRLKPSFWWLRVIVGRFEPGSAVSYSVLVFSILSVVVCVLLQFAIPAVLHHGEWWLMGVTAAFVLLLVICEYQNMRYSAMDT
jgi:hypothetical protein